MFWPPWQVKNCLHNQLFIPTWLTNHDSPLSTLKVKEPAQAFAYRCQSVSIYTTVCRSENGYFRTERTKLIQNPKSEALCENTGVVHEGFDIFSLGRGPTLLTDGFVDTFSLNLENLNRAVVKFGRASYKDSLGRTVVSGIAVLPPVSSEKTGKGTLTLKFLDGESESIVLENCSFLITPNQK